MTPIAHTAYDTMMIFLCVRDGIFVVVYDTTHTSPWSPGCKPTSQCEADHDNNEKRFHFSNHCRQYDDLKHNIYIRGLCCQKQVSQAGISNCIPQNTVRCNYSFLPEITASGNKVHILSYKKYMPNTVKPVCNDHLYNKIYYLWFIQQCVSMKTEDTNLLLLTMSAFWSSSRWPLAT